MVPKKKKKSNKFLLNLEKKRGIQGQKLKIIANKEEISDEKRINVETELFYKNLFKDEEKSSVEHTFLDTLPLPILNESERLCEGALTEKNYMQS